MESILHGCDSVDKFVPGVPSCKQTHPVGTYCKRTCSKIPTNLLETSNSNLSQIAKASRQSCMRPEVAVAKPTFMSRGPRGTGVVVWKPDDGPGFSMSPASNNRKRSQRAASLGHLLEANTRSNLSHRLFLKSRSHRGKSLVGGGTGRFREGASLRFFLVSRPLATRSGARVWWKSYFGCWGGWGVKE